MTTNLVAGETVEALATAFATFQLDPTPDDMVRFHTVMDEQVALPFRRALLRVEAELLTQEADELTNGQPLVDRTDDQRRADALVVLAERFATAASAATGSPNQAFRR